MAKQKLRRVKKMNSAGVIDIQKIKKADQLHDNQRIRSGDKETTVGKIKQQLTTSGKKMEMYFKKAEKKSIKRLEELKKKYKPTNKKKTINQLKLTIRKEIRNTDISTRKIPRNFDISRRRRINPQIFLVATPTNISRVKTDPAIVEPLNDLFIGIRFAGSFGQVWIGDQTHKALIEVKKWADERWRIIHARIPRASNLPKAFGDGFFKFDLWVESGDGAESNKWPLEWITDVRFLSELPPFTNVASCSGEANLNKCHATVVNGAPCALNIGTDNSPLRSVTGRGIRGEHFKCWAAVGRDKGSDRYLFISNQNWFLDSIIWDFFVTGKIPDQGSVNLREDSKRKDFFTFKQNVTSWEPTVEWEVTPNDWAAYKLVIIQRGAKGF